MDNSTYKSGLFNVPDGHVLNYELYGNPKGIPVLFFHGGPGAGFRNKDKRFFDPKIFNVIFFDQRGAGKSTPFGSLCKNNTQKLIGDTKNLLDFLGFKKVILFGGSWGSTLALTFAIRHTSYVSGMILRGIFLGTKAEIKHYCQGGVAKFCPEVWERFIGLVPEAERGNIPAYYLKKMTDGTKETEKYAYEWAYYETSLLRLRVTKREILENLGNPSCRALSLLEAYYMVNNCFLPDNYILDKVGKLSSIPTSIIHGRYDLICPPINAYNLSKKISGSRLFFVTAGHSAREKAIEKKVISELVRMASLLQKKV